MKIRQSKIPGNNRTIETIENNGKSKIDQHKLKFAGWVGTKLQDMKITIKDN